MKKIISGIQQIGIGISDLHTSWKWYRENFNMDIRIFEDAAEAPLMTKYTGGKVHKRNAALAMNMQGGGGFEIWQYTSRKPHAAEFQLQLGDLGIYAIKIKTRNVSKVYKEFQKRDLNIIGGLNKTPQGREHFYMKDPNGNLFEVVEGTSWFSKNESLTGGAFGCTIGVSNMDKSLSLYRDVLGYDEIIYDRSEQFTDLDSLEGGNKRIRRVLLAHSTPKKGAFSRLLGDSQMELVQALDYEGKKIFENRYWGDLGYIHLCFDVRNMNALKEECEEVGFPFTVDSDNSFDMGKAAGRFSYIEDPDGTLIEFVETHKLPVSEKWGLYLNLKNRVPEKELPKWLLNSLRFNKVKD